MLYISRLVGASKAAVMDTDDGVETIVTYRDLCDYVLCNGIEIKGVETGDDIYRRRIRRVIKRIGVYQPEEFVSKEQVKTKLFRGVDVIVNDGVLVSILIDWKVAQRGTRIRLSDYASKCGDDILHDLDFSMAGALWLIVDDKIKVTSKSLKDAFTKGCSLDVRECTDKSIVTCICRELVSCGRHLEDIEKFVCDNELRMDYYRAIMILNRPRNANPEITHIREVIRNTDEINRLISKKFRTEFINIAKASIQPRSCDLQWFVDRNFIRWLEKPGRWMCLADGNYEQLRNDDYIDIFQSIIKMTTLNRSAVYRFENYIKYFDPIDEIKQAYVRFCIRGCKWLLLTAVQYKWTKDQGFATRIPEV